MEEIARLVRRLELEGADARRCAALKNSPETSTQEQGSRIYHRSLQIREGVLHFIAASRGPAGAQKHLYMCSEKRFTSPFAGSSAVIAGVYLFRADRTAENVAIMHELFPFTRPMTLRKRRTTIGCGDRLGMASPGHIRAIRNLDASPVLAQQSMRELTLTHRDFAGVVADASFLVFQEGFEDGYGADGDHLKNLHDIDLALEAGMPMITLDLTEVMSPEPASWSASRMDDEFERLDAVTKKRIRDTYEGRTFELPGLQVGFDRTEARRCALMYEKALDFAVIVDRHLREKRGFGYDLEVSIDETTAPTLPAHHLYIASELARREVMVNSIAPRFIGEFQKGIDYIGDLREFEKQLAAHCAIARARGGYKVSVHSGSDKFSAYAAIGRQTDMRLHLKTAGTSWLEALRVIARTDPALFRKILRRALASFADAARLYHVSADPAAVPPAEGMPDDQLEEYLESKDSRQILHITYGGILDDPEIRPLFFAALDSHEELHYSTVQRHMEKHLGLLGVPARQR